MNDCLPGDSVERTQRRFHLGLATLNRVRLTPCLPEDEDPGGLDLSPLLADEARFLREARARVAPAAALAPEDGAAFVAWFERLECTGPGQGDALFSWLAREAPREAMCWFLEQEVAGEAGFEDLTALVQVRMPTRPKLELARNYWDEMGHGREPGMHGPMLAHLVHALELAPQPEGTVWQSLALANTMAGLALHRHLAFHAIGALGVIELTAPGRAAMVAAGLKRLGVRADDRHYFDLHAVLDIRHSAAWNAEIIGPLVTEDPRRAAAIAEGALMRLECGAACFRRYREHFGLN
ncbi:iron-containing redox enzyme family protein [Gluconacetobacter takamatsuzukensis]|uniref:Iron-containing redox enzyme family protein n=1 Tax=Gluconacetobacter takamatsuzukensis TaxID=1286190 RepID=A0A7W4PQ23_9PROT|nr:iron-containing redox enzyme family protein [Gluconacetobacter takamatsuzukensis]MBB2206050.1 iron-containing redox enzyme family protein [Gluconacetobacter takamatsuzukensis]